MTLQQFNEEQLKQFDFVDFPLAWKLIKQSKKENHHEDCSWRTAGMLCDCAVIDMIFFCQREFKSFLSAALDAQAAYLQSQMPKEKKEVLHAKGGWIKGREWNDAVTQQQEVFR